MSPVLLVWSLILTATKRNIHTCNFGDGDLPGGPAQGGIS